MKKLLTHWLFTPPLKYYSEYTPLEKAWWGLWRKPQDLLTTEQRRILQERSMKGIR